MATQKLSWEKIHEAIHSGADSVLIGNILFKIQKSKTNGCRYVWYQDSILGRVMIMEQNKTKSSDYALRARNGETFSWVIPDNKAHSWVLIETPVQKLTPVPAAIPDKEAHNE